MTITIRFATIPDDYPGMAQLLTAENPEWPTTPDELAYEDCIRDPKLYHAVLVAEETSLQDRRCIVGVARVGHDPQSYCEGKFMMDIRVHPSKQGQGIGTSLYQALLTHLEAFSVCELYTEVWAAHTHAVQFVLRRGFVEVWRRIDSTLDVATFDYTPYIGLEEHVHAKGVQITNYANLANDPDRLPKLYQLDQALWQDVPFGDTITHKSLEQFEKEEIQAAHFIPEACLIAVHKDTFIGYCNLTRGDGYYLTTMTGVLPPYRGLGIASLLKLYSIRYAQPHGNLEIRTVNDSVNEAILALNAKLGFQRQGSMIRFMKRLIESQ